MKKCCRLFGYEEPNIEIVDFARFSLLENYEGEGGEYGFGSGEKTEEGEGNTGGLHF